MFLFSDTARAAASHLLAGRNVRLVGAPGSGRSSTAKAVAEYLERRGVDVFQARGVEGVVALGYVLDQLDLGQRSAGRPVDAVTAAVRSRLLAGKNAVVVVDDADWSDSLSAHVLFAISREVPLLRVLLPDAVVKPAQREATVPMPSLGYESVAFLTEQALGSPAATSLVARIFGKSGGNPELVIAIAESARFADLLVERDGTWHLAGPTLWNDHLRQLADWRLRGLEALELDLLRRMAESGPRSRDAFVESGDLDILERLARRGLIRNVSESDGYEMVHIWPPLIGDMLVRESDFDREPLGPPADEAISASRVFQREVDEQAPKRFRLWSSAPSAANGIEYLRSASGSRFEREQIERVVTETSTQDGPLAAALQFEFQRAQWWASDEGDLPRALESLETFARRRPEGRAGATAAALLLQAFLDHVPGNFADVLDPEGDPTGLAAQARMLLDVFDGDIPAARRFAAEHAGSVSSDPAGITAPLIQILSGDAELVQQEARVTRGRALASRDRYRYLGASYIAAYASIVSGRVENLDAQIDRALGTANASMLLRPLFGATLNIGAMSTALRKGISPQTAARIEGAESYSPRPGPLYGMGVDITTIVARSARQPAEFDESFSVAIRKRRQLGFYMSAAASAVLGACVAIGPDIARECGLISEHVKIPVFTRAFEAVDAIQRRDTRRLEQISARPANGDAAVLAQVVGAAHRRAERETDTAFALALGPIAARLSQDDVGDYEALRVTFDESTSTLTAREREIAVLAGSLRNAEIASRLGISVRTVENHIGRALRKLSAKTRNELSAAAASDS
ncbi:helix-turn-helix transcriptional regulator [Leifsonia aquatica]|uniref:helix-turn-helix transcriptional regulator n=1 Tax=Leifsonia aquatica TaxID=144185 RepID=UPI00382F0F21